MALTLNANEVYSSLSNMIISQEVFADRLSTGSSLVDKARVDGGLYGDTKLFYSADILEVHDWNGDAEAQNLLALDRPTAPSEQAVTINVFKQIRLTLDDYLTKRAWMNEGAFGQFNSVMEAYIGKTKDIYDEGIYNVFIGTTESSEGKQEQTLDLTGKLPEERAKAIAEKVANIIADLKKAGRQYNDLGQMTKFDESQIKIIWNSKYVNEIRKVDVPAIFHKEGLIDKFAEEVLHEDYFGAVNSGAGTATASTFSAIAGEINNVYYIPGEKVKTGASYTAGQVYTKYSDVICKILVKLPPFMSGFEVGTTFFNSRSLTENRYLTWSHNTLEYLEGYPFITLKEVEE